MRDFAATRAALEQGVRDGLHPGAQICVLHRGRPVLEAAVGEARPGVAMTTDSILAWFSAGKPLVALAVAQLIERGRLDWDTCVAEVLPAFGQGGKEHVTVRHLLTHTAGLRAADAIPFALPWSKQLEQICATPLETDWKPGARAGYHLWSTWAVLGEIILRVGGRPVEGWLRTEILDPLRLPDTGLVRPGHLSTEDARVAHVFDTTGESAQPKEEWNAPDAWGRARPGGGLRGRVRDLARFYEALRTGGEGLARRETVALMTSCQRTGLRDETFQYAMDWGLGFVLNSNRGGLQMPYGYGRHASADSFGHSGNQSSCGFVDRARELVVAWACNGLPGERRHQQRQRAINNAIYEDLGVAAV